MKKLLFFFLLFSVSVLAAETQIPFSFDYLNGTAIESISGHRTSNADGTDSVAVFTSTPVTYRVLSYEDGTLGLPATLESKLSLFLEVTVGADTWIIGTIPPLVEYQNLVSNWWIQGTNLAFYLLILFVLAWYARHD